METVQMSDYRGNLFTIIFKLHENIKKNCFFDKNVNYNVKKVYRSEHCNCGRLEGPTVLHLVKAKIANRISQI